MENYIIRSKSRRQLKDRMGLAVGTILLSTILLNIVNVMLDITDDNILLFSLLFAIGYLFISAPIQAGRCKFLLNMVQGKEEPKISDLFSQFNIFLKVFTMSLIIFIFQSLIMLISILIIKGLLSADVMSTKLSVSSITLIFMILLAISIFLFFIDIIYSQVNYIMVEEQEIKVIECMKKSRKMMKGFKFKYFKLQISFIGWWIFSIFTLGIATLWVNSYSMLANANFYEEVKNINVEVQHEKNIL